MSTPTPDPVHQLIDNLLADSPPAALPLARYPDQHVTIIPIDASEALADVMDAAAREARRDLEEEP